MKTQVSFFIQVLGFDIPKTQTFTNQNYTFPPISKGFTLYHFLADQSGKVLIVSRDFGKCLGPSYCMSRSILLCFGAH